MSTIKVDDVLAGVARRRHSAASPKLGLQDGTGAEQAVAVGVATLQVTAAGAGEALAPVQHAAVVDDEEVAGVELENELERRPLQDWAKLR